MFEDNISEARSETANINKYLEELKEIHDQLLDTREFIQEFNRDGGVPKFKLSIVGSMHGIMLFSGKTKEKRINYHAVSLVMEKYNELLRKRKCIVEKLKFSAEYISSELALDEDLEIMQKPMDINRETIENIN